MLYVMTRQTQLNIRLTLEEMEKLEAYAEHKGYTKSEVIRDYIKSLSDTPPKGGRRSSHG
jgi:predicted DNA-binding protein